MTEIIEVTKTKTLPYYQILDLELYNQEDAKRVRDFLHLLLKSLWEQAEGFSGKRPFGNSDWQYRIVETFLVHELILGKYEIIKEDDYECIEILDFDFKEVDTLVYSLLDYVFYK